jgi:hypothetical protein
MANEARNASLGYLLKLAANMAANKEELAHLEVKRLKLVSLLADFQQATQERSALIFRKQELSKRILALLGELKKVATLLRVAVREHYGNRSEKLAEFELQPFRGRPRKVKPAEEELPEVTDSNP